ncbi:glycosyltransferase family 4 protein [Thermodesulfatator autotrophicus]|uniref:Glycosyl transferase family 1 domain-containing protein n=1 Tax=Thermodesulfatator autotrophicus TaxID=1795632 RepID=A0A177E701_9BACT|nr:glycosyltransferase family 4 protein [Thermodesulfatator autotrophicus]OAG27002.1 hypothetical protein TH606_09245 [Thermodesulfatator autotrophicus]
MKGKLKVLYLTMNPNRQSTTVPTELWFRCLSPKLFPVIVFDKKGPFFDWTSKSKIPSYHISLPFPNKKFPIPFLMSLVKLALIVKKYDIQLIHANEHDIYPISKFLSNLLKIPIVVSVHSIIPKDFGLWAFKNSKYLKRIYFVSKSAMQNSLPALKNLPKNIFMVLPNCIDPNKYYPDPKIKLLAKERLNLSNAFLVGAAAALQPIKQLEHIVYALSKIENNSVKFVLAGGPKAGFESYVQAFLDFASDILKNRFIYLGHLDDLLEFYNLIDVYVSTSKEEAFGISVLEALSTGCPVIAYPSKGALKEIINERIGIVIPQDRIDALTEAIIFLKNNEELRNSMGIEARKYVIENYSMETISHLLWEDYLQILNQN